MKEIGIDSQDKYDKSGLNISKCVNRDIKEFKARTYTKSHFKNYRHMSIQEIIDACTPENSAAHIPFLPKDKIDLEILKDFLIVNENKLDSAVSSYASSFRKLAAYYDRLKYGW